MFDDFKALDRGYMGVVDQVQKPPPQSELICVSDIEKLILDRLRTRAMNFHFLEHLVIIINVVAVGWPDALLTSLAHFFITWF